MNQADLAEAWKTSRVSYAELVYRPILRSGFAPKDSGSPRSVKSALRGATINKLIFSLFTMAGAAFPFVLYELGKPGPFCEVSGGSCIPQISLDVTVALSILLVFGYIVLYLIQILPSFVSSGSFAPLNQLPLASGEIAKVATLTLWRTMDYIIVLSLVTQFAAVAYFTGSAVGALLVLVATASGSLLALAMALWLTSVFQRRLEGGSMAGIRGFFRPLLFVLWGLGVMSAVFLFSLVSFVAPPLEALLADPGSPLGIAASLVFPFSAGLLVASSVGESVGTSTLVTAWAGMLIALIGSLAAALGASRMINGVVLPNRQGSARSGLVDYSFKVLSPLSAYIRKDIRVASRNPATGFLFALPVFEIIAVVVPLTATPVVRISALLVGTQVGGGFALFIAFLLVTVEDLGVERRTALPLRESVRTLSKVLISTATYVPVPLALSVMLFAKTFYLRRRDSDSLGSPGLGLRGLRHGGGGPEGANRAEPGGSGPLCRGGRLGRGCAHPAGSRLRGRVRDLKEPSFLSRSPCSVDPGRGRGCRVRPATRGGDSWIAKCRESGVRRVNPD